MKRWRIAAAVAAVVAVMTWRNSTQPDHGVILAAAIAFGWAIAAGVARWL